MTPHAEGLLRWPPANWCITTIEKWDADRLDVRIAGAIRETVTKKEVERVYLDRFIEATGELRGANIIESESPDFLCTVAGRTIGLEVTRLFHDQRFGKHAPRAVHTFREQIVERARQLYMGTGRGGVHVGVPFEDCEIKDPEAAARKLAEFIAASVVDRADDFLASADEDSRLLPEFLQIRVNQGQGLWAVTEAQRAPHLTREILQSAVDSKAPCVEEYRRKADECWLVLVLDRYPLAGSFSVQENALTANFHTGFDRVDLLLSMERLSHRLKVSPPIFRGH